MRIKLLAIIILSSVLLASSNSLLAQVKKTSTSKILGCVKSDGLRSAEYEGFLADDLQKTLLDEDGEPILSERQMQMLTDAKEDLALRLLIRADMLFFEKEGYSPFAAKDSNKNNDGDVLLENHFIRSLFKRTIEENSRTMINEKEYYAFLVLLGHELSHIRQAKYGTSAKNVKENELEADKRAGAILRFHTSPNKDPNLPKETAKMILQHWDNLYQSSANYLFGLGDYEFTEKNHHGTPIERVNAFLSGITSVNDLENQCYADSKELASLKNSQNTLRLNRLNSSLNTTADKFLELGIDPAIFRIRVSNGCHLPTEKSRAFEFFEKK